MRNRFSLFLGAFLWLLVTFFLEAICAAPHLQVELTSDAADAAQLFYSSDGAWSEQQSQVVPSFAGWNRITFTIPQLRPGGSVRFDPGVRATTYRVSAVRWLCAGITEEISLTQLVNPRPEQTMLKIVGGIVELRSVDNDAQLIVPGPTLFWRLATLAIVAALPLLGLAGLFFAYRQRFSLSQLSIASLGVCSAFYAICEVTSGLTLPLFDDWRYVLPGQFNIVDGSWQWLSVVANDTYFLTNQLFDFAALKLSDTNFFAVRMVGVAVLFVHIAIQARVLYRAARGNDTVAGVAIALEIWALAAGAYWTSAGVAYQQALPAVVTTLLLALLLDRDGGFRKHVRLTPIVILCLASGLSYISGGLLLLALGMSILIVVDRSEFRSAWSTGAIIATAGTLLLGLQFWLVASHQGSLIEHNHAVPSVYPHELRFWIFFVAQFGKAFGYAGTFVPLDVFFATIALAPAGLIVTGRLFSSKRLKIKSPSTSWMLLGVLSGIGSGLYAAVIAFGRAGFAPADSAIAAIDAVGKGRFHFWPIATMLPYIWLGWVGALQQLGFGQRSERVLAIAMLLPKSALTFALTTYLLGLEDLSVTGAHCIVDAMRTRQAAQPIICPAVTGVSIDLGPTIDKLRDHNAAVYRAVIQNGGG